MGATPIDDNVADGNLANRNIRLISADYTSHEILTPAASYIFATMSSARNATVTTVPTDARIFKILTVLSPSIFEHTANRPIPITPPRVLPSRSVMSLAPMAKQYCRVSYSRLTANMGRTFPRKLMFWPSIGAYPRE